MTWRLRTSQKRFRSRPLTAGNQGDISSVPAALFQPLPLRVVGVAVLCNALLLRKDGIDDTDIDSRGPMISWERKTVLIWGCLAIPGLRGSVHRRSGRHWPGSQSWWEGTVPGLHREESDTMVFALEVSQAKLGYLPGTCCPLIFESRKFVI